MKLLISLASLIFYFNAFSSEKFNPQYVKELPALDKGGWSSGGGNAVICFNPEKAKEAITKINEDGSFPDELFDAKKNYIASIQTLDLFEARLSRGLPSSLPEIIEIAHDEDIISYSEKISMRFQEYVRPVSLTIDQGRGFLPQANIRLYNGAVAQNRDIGHPNIINNKLCRITTIANQGSQNEFYELYIDSRAFNYWKHEKISKAVLLLHEYVYAAARSKGEKDSLTSRKLVEVAITKHPDFTINYVSKLVTNLVFTNIPLPDLSVYNRHVYNAMLLDYPLYMLYLTSKSMTKDLLNYKPDNFKQWVSKFKTELEKFSVFVDLKDNSSLEDVYSWYLNKTKLPANEDQMKLYRELESFVKERGMSVFRGYKLKIAMIKGYVSKLPPRTSDKVEIKESIDETFRAFMNASSTYVDSGKGKIENSLVVFSQEKFEVVAKALHSIWHKDDGIHYASDLATQIP